MYQKALYFKSKFLRNGIIMLLLSGLQFYQAYSINEPFSPALLIIPVLSFVWIYFGLLITKQLKTKVAINDSNEIADEVYSYKQVELVLTILLLVMFFLLTRHWKYAEYLMFPIALAYLFWLFKQVKDLNAYFKA